MAKEQIVQGLAALLVAGAATAFAASSTQAADLYVPEPEQVLTVDAVDWTGFYLGGHVGYGWGTVEIEDSYDFFEGDVDDIDEYDIAGWLAGVQAGYNHQSGNLVFGIEADLALAGITGDSGNADNDTLGTDVNWLGTLRGRAGFAADKLFFYGTVGVAAAGVTSWLIDDWQSDYFETSGVRYGWVAGFGAEMMVSDDISVKAEYLFHDFGSQDYVFDSDETYITDHLTLSTIKVGINFHF